MATTNNYKKVVIFSAPSGSGKTTIVHHLLAKFPQLQFSISATTRPCRGQEVHGKDYHFLTVEEFHKKVNGGEFIEWEEVYTGRYYGTLKSELDRIWDAGGTVIFDVDVKGGVNIKKLLGNNALAIFVMPPSVEELRKRLESRQTDSTEDIEARVKLAEQEMTYSKYFDRIVVNNKLNDAIKEAEQLVEDWLKE
ncbi:MAG: guanylate kinase [Prevotellaceae bacterium]|jgi:guanylate kinase|nr:guanylate kinase [Prevotellaceae bacterium]